MEQELEPAYYAVIPATVRYDKRIPPNAKLLYGEITALCNKRGYCWASNQHFAALYSVHKDTISAWVSALEKCDYIRTQKDEMAPTIRRIYLTEATPIAVGKKAEGIGKKTEGIGKNAYSNHRQKDRGVTAKTPTGIGKKTEGYRQKDRHNNKENNTESNKGNNTKNTSDANAPVSQKNSSLKNGQKKAPQVAPIPPADTPIVTRIRRVIQARDSAYTWDGKEAKAAERIAAKLRVGINAKKRENDPTAPDCTDDEIENAFNVLIDRTAELKDYYQFTDLPNLNKNYNAIVTQLRNARNNGTSNNRNSYSSNGRQVAPAHRSTTERVSELSAMFNEFDSVFGG
ncbi:MULTISPECIES: helix-turn-helix domain-containing protein [unclassified Spirosoma]|uniref:helix-turn-helix domain-containing protein n=1 Tax=unclassified Spirosoma TaxID=2621999 RepID=UPI00095C7441|nr:MULTISPECIES: helix-turn-helix domain-containing protein [unclassified Spirosoma]MBN8826470.1 helix-turn-helix domain-containing protein [Spirosoma sp.]OJW76437.1 MAG: hypothetical protein BGO59_23270 [Spirosoma sp. 48-14]